ncbi:MAG TPA: tripartite tricarboxylate transporter TctB family protein [Pseudonocardia sp.]|nr:tripartite tricarboxylate transporter TctB family protein [Pseudonocardia sp.]
MRRISALLPIGLGLLWIVSAVMSFPLGSLGEPGPALWPVIVGVLLVVMSLVLLLTERDGEDYEPFTRRSRLVALGVTSTAIFIVVFEYVGFLAAGFLLMLFWTRFLGRESWRLSLLVSAGTALAFYQIFGPMLGVPLPSPFT